MAFIWYSPILHFLGDIDGLAGDGQELAKLVERLDTTSVAYGMEISAEENKADEYQR